MELFLQEKYIMQVMLNCPLTTNFQVAQGRDKHLLLILRDAQTNDTRYVKKVSEITSNRAIKELPRIFFLHQFGIEARVTFWSTLLVGNETILHKPLPAIFTGKTES